MGHLFGPLTYAYNLQKHRSAETTLFDVVFTRDSFGLVMTRVASQGRDTAVEENMGPAQYKRTTLLRLRTVLNHAQ